MNDTHEYDRLQSRLARGWNTWNTRNLLCWVKLPAAVALNLGVKSYCGVRNHVREFQVGEHNIRVGRHAYDGSFSDLSLQVRKTRLRIRTATVDGDLVLLAEPECAALRKSLLVVEIGMLWNRPGAVSHKKGCLYAATDDEEVRCYHIGKVMDDAHVTALSPYFALELSEAVALSTGKPRSLDEVYAIIGKRQRQFESKKHDDGDLNEIYDAIQTCTAWDTIYEPEGKRVITPVSRQWNANRYGGYALFCWDAFFAAILASIDNPDLAHANAIEILRDQTESGFVPNVSSATGRKSRDRSQPPVGSISVLEIYRKYGQKWFLEQTFEPLLKWNRWWINERENQGYLCWGSSPYDPVVGDPREYEQQNTRFGAALESGLDNSPMYDDIPFDDQDTHIMQLADVGLMGLYVADCKCLAEIATEVGRLKEAKELGDRADAMSASLQKLWSEEDGIFLNKRLDTNHFVRRLSPTNFYPLLGRVATEKQARRMVDEHFFKPEEFWGDWILPSIARNDPAYTDQDYWRGRIWAPMNWLVYLGLRNYENLSRARACLVEKSAALLLKEWRQKRHIHENYNADTGDGCDVKNSDHFYHWGGLLGLMKLVDTPQNEFI